MCSFYFSCTHLLFPTILLNGCYIRVKKKYLTLSKTEIFRSVSAKRPAESYYRNWIGTGNSKKMQMRV